MHVRIAHIPQRRNNLIQYDLPYQLHLLRCKY